MHVSSLYEAIVTGLHMNYRRNGVICGNSKANPFLLLEGLRVISKSDNFSVFKEGAKRKVYFQTAGVRTVDEGDLPANYKVRRITDEITIESEI